MIKPLKSLLTLLPLKVTFSFLRWGYWAFYLSLWKYIYFDMRFWRTIWCCWLCLREWLMRMFCSFRSCKCSNWCSGVVYCSDEMFWGSTLWEISYVSSKDLSFPSSGLSPLCPLHIDIWEEKNDTSKSLCFTASLFELGFASWVLFLRWCLIKLNFWPKSRFWRYFGGLVWMGYLDCILRLRWAILKIYCWSIDYSSKPLRSDKNSWQSSILMWVLIEAWEALRFEFGRSVGLLAS